MIHPGYILGPLVILVFAITVYDLYLKKDSPTVKAALDVALAGLNQGLSFPEVGLDRFRIGGNWRICNVYLTDRSSRMVDKIYKQRENQAEVERLTRHSADLVDLMIKRLGEK